jgi:NitT/TauT family transport system permease protein
MAIQSVSPPRPRPRILDAAQLPDAPPAGRARRSGLLPGGGRSTRRGQRPFLSLALPLALGLAALLVWQLVTATQGISAYLLPPPADVLRTFWRALTDPSLSEWLVPYAGWTLAESLVGFALGSLVALPLGYTIARSPLIARTIQPYLAASQALPAVALAPLLVLWLPFGLPPVAALCALIVFFPTVVTTALGIRGLDRDILDAAHVEGAGRWARRWYIELPLALPSILAGLRTSLTLSVTGAVVGEFVIGDQGLGGLLEIARGNNDTPLVFATLLMLALLAMALYGFARLAERRFSYLEAE